MQLLVQTTLDGGKSAQACPECSFRCCNRRDNGNLKKFEHRDCKEALRKLSRLFIDFCKVCHSYTV